MMLKTLAILLSLGTAYSTATYAMNSYEDLSEELQRAAVKKTAAEVAFQQMKEKCDAEDRKLKDATVRNMDALNNPAISSEESDRMLFEFVALKESVRAAKEAALAEYDKQFGNK